MVLYLAMLNENQGIERLLVETFVKCMFKFILVLVLKKPLLLCVYNQHEQLYTIYSIHLEGIQTITNVLFLFIV